MYCTLKRSVKHKITDYNSNNDFDEHVIVSYK